MAEKQPTYDHTSTRTTGNEPIEAVDPGGTRSTKPGQRDKTQQKAEDPVTHHRVSSGDRNTWREARSPKMPE